MAAAAALVATLVSGVFALRLWQRGSGRGSLVRPLRVWSAALTMFSIASAALLVGEVTGWSSALFRTFYLFGAVLNVPWLAHGSVLINAERTVTSRIVGGLSIAAGALFLPAALSDTPDLFRAGAILGLAWGMVHLLPDADGIRAASILVLGLFTVTAVFVILSAALIAPIPAAGVPEGRDMLSEAARGLAVGGNAVGSLIVVVGALASSVEQVWRWPGGDAARRLRAQLVDGLGRGGTGFVDACAGWVFAGRRGVDVGGRVRGNLLIGAGVLIAAAGGALSFLGETTGHAVGLGLGVTVMYGGFRLATRPAAVTQTPDVGAGE